mmetsp:Transcript_36495/g.49813  ORF Transcript_36495/g.49813 Transcript_36495/m.49813 type:complete len:212 (-) Transcript_36495:60-695(-)
MPQAQSVGELTRYADCVKELRVDNLGAVGTRLLLGEMGVADVPASFVRAVQSQYPHFSPQPASQLGLSLCKVHCYAEYRVEVADMLLKGTLMHENGLREGSALRPRWLHAISLPISVFVERELCAEFQLLEAACEVLSRGGASGVYRNGQRVHARGCLRMAVTGASCLSCVGAMRQFQILWPQVDLAVGMLGRWQASNMPTSEIGPAGFQC